jgi:hypothetical protein
MMDLETEEREENSIFKSKIQKSLFSVLVNLGLIIMSQKSLKLALK